MHREQCKARRKKDPYLLFFTPSLMTVLYVSNVLGKLGMVRDQVWEVINRSSQTSPVMAYWGQGKRRRHKDDSKILSHKKQTQLWLGQLLYLGQHSMIILDHGGQIYQDQSVLVAKVILTISGIVYFMTPKIGMRYIQIGRGHLILHTFILQVSLLRVTEFN